MTEVLSVASGDARRALLAARVAMLRRGWTGAEARAGLTLGPTRLDGTVEVLAAPWFATDAECRALARQVRQCLAERQ